MRRFLFAGLLAAISATSLHAAEWRLDLLGAPARVMAIETADGNVQVNAGGLWYRIVLTDGRTTLAFVETPLQPTRPEGALPDARIVSGTRNIARAWLAEPTDRYDHGVLGDKIEAGSLIIETRDGKQQAVKLRDDAVFEDLDPRLADLDGDGRDEIVVVKSYLKRGASLAIVAERRGKFEIVAETPPLGGAHRWLDPVGVADFTGDGKRDIALVRQPHVVGDLELWSWRDGSLRKFASMPDVSNHVAGTRAIGMSAVADFNGDGIADIAVPSRDRSRLRIVTFAPQPREVASIQLPAKAVTNIGLVDEKSGPPAIAVGLEDGSLALIRRAGQ